MGAARLACRVPAGGRDEILRPDRLRFGSALCNGERLAQRRDTKYMEPGQAPQSYADLLDPRWNGRIVKAHPSYIGTILTSTYQIANTLGWDYFQKLAAQKVMQV